MPFENTAQRYGKQRAGDAAAFIRASSKARRGRANKSEFNSYVGASGSGKGSPFLLQGTLQTQRERSMSLAESVQRNGFVHGEQAREVRKINKRFTFDHIDDITSGPGLFDTVFPPLFEENSLLQVTASEQGYAFAVKCSINVKVQQLLKIDIPNNTFTVRLKVTTHWIVPMEHVGSYHHFFEKFKPEVILLNRVGTFGGINSDLYTDADIKRQTVRPRIITEPSKDKLEKRKEDQMKKSVLAHFSITADKTAELRQSFELQEFPFDNQLWAFGFTRSHPDLGETSEDRI